VLDQALFSENDRANPAPSSPPHPLLSLQLIATLLLDYDPGDKGSLGLIKTSLRLLADETPEAEPYFYPSSDEDEDEADTDEVQRMLASWSLDSSTTSGGAAADWPSGSGSSSSDSTSVSGATSSREDDVEFLKMLFPYSSVRKVEGAASDSLRRTLTLWLAFCAQRD